MDGVETAMRTSTSGLLAALTLATTGACGTGTSVTADDAGNTVPGKVGGAYVAEQVRTPPARFG